MSMYENAALNEAWRARFWAPAGSDDDEQRRYRRTEMEEQARLAQAFMDANGLKASRARASIANVAGQHIGDRDQLWYGEAHAYPEALGWFDHSEVFYHAGARRHVITTQPYDLTDEKIAALRTLCEPYGCTVSVYPAAGWHFPGRCPLVVIHPSTVTIRIPDEQ